LSYGFRPGRSPHQALDALATALCRRKVNWVLNADISATFDTIDHAWMMKMLGHRIADKRLLRQIAKWLKAGVLENNRWKASQEGTPQGAVISPLLANIYLHDVLDLWVERERKRPDCGEVVMVRYADDFIIGFQHKEDAERFLEQLRQRLEDFKLRLHPEKTRLIRFGRFATGKRKRGGKGKPPTFGFLGVHPHLRTQPGREVPAPAPYHRQTTAGQVASGQKRNPSPTASAHPGAGCLACGRVTGLLRVRRGADQHPQSGRLPHPGQPRLVPRLAATGPEKADQLAPDEPTYPTLVAPTSNPASMAHDALRFKDSRQEPSAVVPHARISAGGRR
jgi:hypothetical protein